jgi:Domain of unknown function (DUF4328)
LWRARLDAEIVCGAPHRRGRGWIVGSWITPVVSFWFPFMIIDDVYRASRPSNPPDLADLRMVPGSRVIGFWWALWLAGLVVSQVSARILLRDDVDVESFRSFAIASTIASALSIGAAVLIIMIMRQISGWLTPQWSDQAVT